MELTDAAVMSEIVGIVKAVGQRVERVIPPPSRGGFWYLRRVVDGVPELLLDERGDYVRFDSKAEAARAQLIQGDGCKIAYMTRR